MKDVLKKAVDHNYAFWITLTVSIILLIASFIVPPLGIIDSSVLLGISELGFFATLGVLASAIDKGLDARVKHNDTEITIGDLNNKETLED